MGRRLHTCDPCTASYPHQRCWMALNMNEVVSTHRRRLYTRRLNSTGWWWLKLCHECEARSGAGLRRSSWRRGHGRRRFLRMGVFGHDRAWFQPMYIPFFMDIGWEYTTIYDCNVHSNAQSDSETCMGFGYVSDFGSGTNGLFRKAESPAQRLSRSDIGVLWYQLNVYLGSELEWALHVLQPNNSAVSLSYSSASLLCSYSFQCRQKPPTSSRLSRTHSWELLQGYLQLPRGLRRVRRCRWLSKNYSIRMWWRS